MVNFINSLLDYLDTIRIVEHMILANSLRVVLDRRAPDESAKQNYDCLQPFLPIPSQQTYHLKSL